VSERKPPLSEADPIETAHQVHTLAQRLLQHVSGKVQGEAGDQPSTPADSTEDETPVTYWYP
jgi:hypothetical protein